MYSKGKLFLEFEETSIQATNRFDPFSTTILETPTDEITCTFDKEQVNLYSNLTLGSPVENNIEETGAKHESEMTTDYDAFSSKNRAHQNMKEDMFVYNNDSNSIYEKLETTQHNKNNITELTNELHSVKPENVVTEEVYTSVPVNCSSSYIAISQSGTKTNTFNSNCRKEINVKLDQINDSFMKTKPTVIDGVRAIDINGHGVIDCYTTNEHTHTYQANNTDSKEIGESYNENSNHLLGGSTSTVSAFIEDGFPVIDAHDNFITTAGEITTSREVPQGKQSLSACSISEIEEKYCHELVRSCDTPAVLEKNIIEEADLTKAVISGECLANNDKDTPVCDIINLSLSNCDGQSNGYEKQADIFTNSTTLHDDSQIVEKNGDEKENWSFQNLDLYHDKQTKNSIRNEELYEGEISTRFCSKLNDIDPVVTDQRNHSDENTCLMTQGNRHKPTDVISTGDFIDLKSHESSKNNNYNSSWNSSTVNEVEINSQKYPLNSRDRFFQEPLDLDTFQSAKHVYTLTNDYMFDSDSDPFSDIPFEEDDPFAVQSPDPFDTDPFGSKDLNGYSGNYQNTSSLNLYVNSTSGCFRSLSNTSLYRILEEEEPEEVNYKSDTCIYSTEKMNSYVEEKKDCLISFSSEESNNKKVMSIVLPDLPSEDIIHSKKCELDIFNTPINENEVHSFYTDMSQLAVDINTDEENQTNDEKREVIPSYKTSEELLKRKAKWLVELVIFQARNELSQNPFVATKTGSNEDEILPNKCDDQNYSTKAHVTCQLNSSSAGKISAQYHKCNKEISQKGTTKQVETNTVTEVINNYSSEIVCHNWIATESANECILNNEKEKDSFNVPWSNATVISGSYYGEIEQFSQLKHDQLCNNTENFSVTQNTESAVINEKNLFSVSSDETCHSDNGYNSLTCKTEHIELCCKGKYHTFDNKHNITDNVLSNFEGDIVKLTFFVEKIVEELIKEASAEVISILGPLSEFKNTTCENVKYELNDNVLESSLPLASSLSNIKETMCDKTGSNDDSVQGQICVLKDNNYPCVSTVAIEVDECSSPEGEYGCVPPPEIYIEECSSPESSDDNDADIQDLEDHIECLDNSNDDIDVCNSSKVTLSGHVLQDIPVVFIEHCSSPDWSSSEDEAPKQCSKQPCDQSSSDYTTAIEEYIQQIIQEAVNILKEEAMGTETEIVENVTREDNSENKMSSDVILSDDDSYSEEIKQLKDQIPEELTSISENRITANKPFKPAREHVNLNNNIGETIQHRTDCNTYHRPHSDLTEIEINQKSNAEVTSGIYDVRVENNHHKVSDQLVSDNKHTLGSEDIPSSSDFDRDEDVPSAVTSDLLLSDTINSSDKFPLQKELSLADELSQSMTENDSCNDEIKPEKSDIGSPRLNDPVKVHIGHMNKTSGSNMGNQSHVSESDSIYDRIIDTVLTSTPRKSGNNEQSNLLSQNQQTGNLKKKIIPNLDLLNDDDVLDLPDSPTSSSGNLTLDLSNTSKTPDDITTPDFINDNVFGDCNKSTPEPIPEYSAEEEFENNRNWRTVQIGSKKCKIDMRVIEPYKKILSHGGYYGEGFNAIIVFSGCHLPDKRRRDYQYVMDNLFLYVISTLELLVVEDYMMVYFHGATPRDKMPGLKFLKRCYDMIDRKLRKNLKRLLIVHPTFWLKTVVLMTKPFVSSKFYYKMEYVKSLQQLTKLIPTEYVFVPDEVKLVDKKRNRVQPKKKFVNM